MKRLLVACEFSGIVRDAFAGKGWDAWSCDLLPSERPGNHILGDVLNEIWMSGQWDMMIAHPPCTYLASSGARWWKDRIGEQEAALVFVRELMRAPIERICLENPIGLISTRIRKPDQIIQPWQFGHDESKATCLWLKNLPALKTIKLVKRPAGERYSNQTPSGQNKLSSVRSKDRSRTYAGIAQAMAEQWGLL